MTIRKEQTVDEALADLAATIERMKIDNRLLAVLPEMLEILEAVADYWKQDSTAPLHPGALIGTSKLCEDPILIQVQRVVRKAKEASE